MSAAIRFGLYPALWLWIVGCIGYGLARPEQMQAAAGVKSGVMVVVLLLAEWRWPYQRRWSMRWRSLLRRDLVFIAVNGATLAAIQTGLVWIALDVSESARGPLTGRSLWLQVPVALLAFEALQYGLHRLMHRSDGPVTNVLWRAHAIHHLPQQLYLVMHAVFHPINALLVRLFVQVLPLALLGTDPAAAFVAASVIGFHGTISHFNVDVRAGWANYLFVGPELHRYHHSAKAPEAANYAAVLPLFDLLFGTFLYRPGVPPEELGLDERDGYPGQEQPWRALLLPFSTRPVEPKLPAPRGASGAARPRRSSPACGGSGP